jgi:hypothetical protein
MRKKHDMITYSGLLWELDQINPAKYEFKLFNSQEGLIERSDHPRKFWCVKEFYPSYMLINTPFIVAGQMPIDLPWFYAWLTVMDEQPRQTGFLLSNLINTIPPKHVEVGTFIKGNGETNILKRYYALRQTVKSRIETFWNSLADWYALYTRMKEYSYLLLSDPFDPTPGLDPAAITSEIQAFEGLVDRFFQRFLPTETLDQFFARMMSEIDKHESAFARFSFSCQH